MSQVIIGLNLVFLHEQLAGIRVVTVNTTIALLKTAADEPRYSHLHFVIYTTQHGLTALRAKPSFDRAISTLGGRVRILTLNINPRRKLAKLACEEIVLPYYIARDHVTVLHSFDYTMPYLANCAQVVSILDLNYRHNLGTFTWSARLARKILLPLSVRSADRVSCLTEASLKEVADTFGVPRERFVVAGAGIEQRDASAHVSMIERTAKSPTILSVGTLNRHKNYARLIESLSYMDVENTKLVIVGRDNGQMVYLENIVKRLQLADAVCLPGAVPQGTLDAYYESATVFAFPSLYEGFGIPVLEAMSVGLPVVCSDIPTLREVAGSSAEYFDPENPESIAQAISRVLEDHDRRREMVREGVARSRQFTWASPARRLLQTYLSLL